MQENKTNTNSKVRKGIIFTITIFILSSVLLDYSIYLSEHNNRHDPYFFSVSDAQILNSRLDELATNAQRALGVKADMQRNDTHLTISFEDNGFAFAPSGSGISRADLRGFKTFYENTWANTNNLSCALNVALPNSSGIYYQTSDKINYTHDNSNSQRDVALLAIPSDYEFSHIIMDIYCDAPDTYSDFYYSCWQNDPTQTKIVDIIYNDDEGNSQVCHTNFNQLSSQVFYTNYTYTTGLPPTEYMTQQFYFNLQTPNILNISDLHQTSKQDVFCKWNLSVVLDYTYDKEQHLFIPINASLKYMNSQYSGYLPVKRK